MRKLVALLKKEKGATLLEYALLAMLIAMVCILAIALVGGELNNEYVLIDSSFTR